MQTKKKVAIFISGRGSNMRALLEDMEDVSHPGQPALIVSDKDEAQGLTYAKKQKIKTFIIGSDNSLTQRSVDDQLLATLKEHKIDLICLAGFMKILSKNFLDKYQNTIINIHPSLLPLFKGLNTHKKALKSGMALHGATVHIVTPHLDSGKILGQIVVPIVKGDTEKGLKKRVLKAEHQLYPVVLRRVLLGKINAPILLEY